MKYKQWLPDPPLSLREEVLGRGMLQARQLPLKMAPTAVFVEAPLSLSGMRRKSISKQTDVGAQHELLLSLSKNLL